MSRATPKRLTHAQSFKVMTWLSTQRDRIERETTTYPELIQEVKKNTDVDISRPSILWSIKELGIRPKFKSGQHKSNNGIQPQLDTLLEQQKELSEMVLAIVRDMKSELVRIDDGSFRLVSKGR